MVLSLLTSTVCVGPSRVPNTPVVPPTQLFLATDYSGTVPAVPGGDYRQISVDGLNWKNLYTTSSSIGPQTNGIRDPKTFSYTYNSVEKWYRFYSDGNGTDPVVYIDVASDATLQNWSRVVTLTTAVSSGNNYMDALSVLMDGSGIHFQWTNDATRAWSSISPNSPDPSTWTSQANFSSISVAFDIHGSQISTGDFFPVFNGTSYEAIEVITSGVFQRRTSSALMTGWSDPVTPTTDALYASGEATGFNRMPDGTYRVWVSNGNTGNYKQWLSVLPTFTSAWSNPQEINITGYQSDTRFNWILQSNTVITNQNDINFLLSLNP